jgi:dihydrofolate reductase
MIKAIFACDDNWGIGLNGDLPWPKNSADLKWFRDCTNAKAVVMGRKTWESLPIKPLPNRLNFVITSDNMENYNPRPHGSYSGKDVGKIIKDVIEARCGGINDVWIIGGSQLFESCMDVIDEIWLSRIKGNYKCDTVLPKDLILEKFELYERYFDGELTTEKYKRITNEAIS